MSKIKQRKLKETNKVVKDKFKTAFKKGRQNAELPVEPDRWKKLIWTFFHSR